MNDSPIVPAPEAVTFHCRVARGPVERAAYFALRRDIFCEEQGVFARDDEDAEDAHATPLVCFARDEAGHETLAGVVRLYRAGPSYPPDTWFGGRLGVAREYRTAGVVGRMLVKTAVGTAVAWGCQRFLATVQEQNEPFFRRLRWHTREELVLVGRRHVLMEADLRHYPPVVHVHDERPDAPERVHAGLAPAPGGHARNERIRGAA